MTDIVNKKPVIGQGWARATIFCILYLVLIFFVAPQVQVLISFNKAATQGSEGLTQPGNNLWFSLLINAFCAMVAVFICRKIIDRNSLVSLGLEPAGRFSDGAAGFFLAPVILGTGGVVLFFSGHLQWVDVNFDGNSLFISFGMMVILSFAEELVFRGYVLGNLMESVNKWLALFLSAVLYAVVHSALPGANLLSVGGLFLSGLVLGINYIYTRNLWFAIMFHLGWNFLGGALLGFKIAGLSVPSLLQMEVKGDAMITGGDFGFEASMINILLMLVGISSLYFIYDRKFKGSLENITR